MFVVCVCVCVRAMTLDQHVFVMPGYVLALLRRPPKALGAVVAAVGVVLGVNGDNVAFEAGSVRTVVLTILALINLSTTVRLHVLLQLGGLPEASPAALALKGEFLRVQRQDVATQGEGVGGVEVTMPALVHLVALVRLRVLLQLRGPVEAFLAHVALVGEVLGVNGDDVSLQVAGVGALVVAVRTLVGLVALHHLYVPLELPCVGVGLGTVAALERQIGAVLALDVSL